MIKKLLSIFAVALIVAVSTAQATPVKSISATTAVTSFVGGPGSALTMGCVGGINVEYTSGPVGTYMGGQFGLNTTLLSDASTGGIASGNFTTGSFFFQEFGGNVLLSGSITSFNLTETYHYSGMFFGNGIFNVTGGSLQPNFGSSGTMVDITFSVSPNTINNFSSSFLASSNMTVLPASNQTPEPATIILMSLGMTALLRKKKLAAN